MVSPYTDWDTHQLQAYLNEKGAEATATAGANKDALVERVKTYWYETEDMAEDAYNSVKDWIFDT